MPGTKFTIRGEEFTIGDRLGFWARAEKGDWEPETFRILEENIKPDEFFMDIGAWIGPTTLFASRKCKSVFAFEPDRVAKKELRDNIRSSKTNNVRVLSYAIAGENGPMGIGNKNGKLGNSMSSVFSSNAVFPVMGMTLSYAFNTFKPLAGTKCSFMKMDTEGAEAFIIPEAVDFLLDEKISIWLSLHWHIIPKKHHGKLLSALENFRCFNKRYMRIANPLAHDTLLIRPHTLYPGPSVGH